MLFVATDALATSPPCEPLVLLGASVVDGEQQVPRDARLLLSLRPPTCEGWTVALLRDGVAVDSDLTSGATQVAGWASVKPRAALEPDATYTLRASGGNQSASVVFTTGDALAAPSPAAGRPSLTVVGSQFGSPLSDDGAANAVFELSFEAPADARTRGGAFFVGLETSPVSGHGSASALAFARDASPVRASVWRRVRPGQPVCFTTRFEDGAGRLSAPSDETCATVPGEPPSPPRDDSSRTGCATSSRASGGGSSFALVGLVAVLVRLLRARAGGRASR